MNKAYTPVVFDCKKHKIQKINDTEFMLDNGYAHIFLKTENVNMLQFIVNERINTGFGFQILPAAFISLYRNLGNAKYVANIFDKEIASYKNFSGEKKVPRKLTIALHKEAELPALYFYDKAKADSENILYEDMVAYAVNGLLHSKENVAFFQVRKDVFANRDFTNCKQHVHINIINGIPIPITRKIPYANNSIESVCFTSSYRNEYNNATISQNLYSFLNKEGFYHSFEGPSVVRIDNSYHKSDDKTLLFTKTNVKESFYLYGKKFKKSDYEQYLKLFDITKILGV